MKTLGVSPIIFDLGLPDPSAGFHVEISTHFAEPGEAGAHEINRPRIPARLRRVTPGVNPILEVETLEAATILMLRPPKTPEWLGLWIDRALLFWVRLEQFDRAEPGDLVDIPRGARLVLNMALT